MDKDSKLMRFVIFRYKSADAYKNCQRIWGEVEKAVFEGAIIKVTAYRGITEEYWSFNKNSLATRIPSLAHCCGVIFLSIAKEVEQHQARSYHLRGR